MKKTLLISPLIVVLLHFDSTIHTNNRRQTVNPLLGDISFVHKFGFEPNLTTDEDLRIKTHLEYVESLLRLKDMRDLKPELRLRRKQLLDLLHDYWITGIFPRNYDYKDNREPCFIDKDNRICAVGYLIEKTAGIQTAQDINAKHKYDRILAMNDKMVDNWIEASGLSKEECAMIQPTYGSTGTISPAYGISSSLLGGLNLSLTTINGIQISKGADNKTTAVLGLVSGAGQTILGVSMFPRANNFWGNTTREDRKTLSMVNIGLGTTTMILSAWNLIANRKARDKKLTWSLDSFETPYSNTGMAVTFRRKI